MQSLQYLSAYEADMREWQCMAKLARLSLSFESIISFFANSPLIRESHTLSCLRRLQLVRYGSCDKKIRLRDFA